MTTICASSCAVSAANAALGELRGKEAFAFLRAVNSGHPGSLTTVHANESKEVDGNRDEEVHGPYGSSLHVDRNYKVVADEHMSFLEMLDVVNEDLIVKGKEPIAFDHDCREGICGMCGMVINGEAHGPQKLTTTCQLHMRQFQSGDEIVIEPWRADAFPVLRDLIVDRSAFDRIIQSGGYVSVRAGQARDDVDALGRLRVCRLRQRRGAGQVEGAMHRLTVSAPNVSARELTAFRAGPVAWESQPVPLRNTPPIEGPTRRSR